MSAKISTGTSKVECALWILLRATKSALTVECIMGHSGCITRRAFHQRRDRAFIRSCHVEIPSYMSGKYSKTILWMQVLSLTNESVLYATHYAFLYSHNFYFILCSIIEGSAGCIKSRACHGGQTAILYEFEVVFEAQGGRGYRGRGPRTKRMVETVVPSLLTPITIKARATYNQSERYPLTTQSSLYDRISGHRSIFLL